MNQNRQSPDHKHPVPGIKAAACSVLLLWISSFLISGLFGETCLPGKVFFDMKAEAAVKKKTAAKKRKYRISMRRGQKRRLKKHGLKGKVHWKSSNKKILRVTQSGKVYARRKGKAKVFASSGKKKICYIITVKGKKKKNTDGKTQTYQIPGTEKESGADCLAESGETKDPGSSSGECIHSYVPVSTQVSRTVTDSPAWDEVVYPDLMYAQECGCGRQFPVYSIAQKDKVDIQAADLAAKEAHARHCEEECAPYEEELARLEMEGVTGGEIYQRAYQEWERVFNLHSSYHGVDVYGEPVSIHHAAVTHTEMQPTIIGYRCSKCGKWK